MNSRPFIIAFDIAGSTQLDEINFRYLRQVFDNIINNIKDFDFYSEVYRDSGYIIFPNIEIGYKYLKKIISDFINAKDIEISPILVGLRLGIGTSFSYESESGKKGYAVGINPIFRLMSVCEKDKIVFYSSTFQDLKEFFKKDNIYAKQNTYELKNGQKVEGYELKLDCFFNKNQYLIRIEPPTDLIMYLSSHPNKIYNLSPRKFEEIIATIFEKFGYEIELTKQTRDNGIDIIAFKKSDFIQLDERYLIQCKRNAPKNKVGVSIVREILGVGVEEPHTGLIIATTSSFTKPALKLAKLESLQWKLHLKDYFDIQQWLIDYSKAKK